MKTASPAVPLFFAAALGALVGLARPWPLWPLALGTLLLVAAALVARAAAARAAWVLAAAFALAMLGAAVERQRGDDRRAALPPGPAVFEGIVDDLWYGARGPVLALSVSGVLTDGAPEARVLRVAVHLAEDMAPPRPGDRVRVLGAARPLLPALSPGAFDDAALGLARGIDARLHLREAHELAVMEQGAAWAPFSNLRLALRARLVQQLTPREAGLVLALLVGDTSLIDDEQRALYRAAGAGHLLAVSGLQVTLLAMLLRWLSRSALLVTPWGRRGRGQGLAAALALAGVWAFVALCGAPPSAVRAGGMGSAVLLAGLLGRRASLLDALGVAGLVTVLLSPVSVIDPSFLLSYAAVIGLVAASAPSPSAGATPDDALAGLWPKLRGAALTAVGAGAVTVPVSAFLFGQLAPAGLVANVVLVPAASILQVPALVGGALGAALDLPCLSWLGAQAALMLEALTAGLAALLPGMRLIEAPSGGAALLLFGLAVAAVAAAVRRRALPAALAAAAAILLVALGGEDASRLRLTVLPVGQGDCTVAELPDGSVLLIDGGANDSATTGAAAEVLLPFLERRGIRRIDVMVLSHPHPDHALGLVPVAERIPVGELWLTEAEGDEGSLGQRVRQAVGNAARVRTTPSLLGVHRYGEATVEVLAPAPAERTATYPELSVNDNSLVLRLCLQGQCALWPGDIEALGEEQLLSSGVEMRAAVVKAPHHGSPTSSVPAFIERSGAAHVIFCTGPGNQFGFPAAPVIERWRAAGARMWDTAVHGQIAISLGADGVRVRSFRDGEVVPGTGSARR